MISEAERHRLYNTIEGWLGEEANTLMAMLPSSGWADVATKQDLVDFGARYDLDSMATKQDLAAFATRYNLDDMATKQDLAEFATRYHLDDMATKQDLAEFATRYDLDDMATKQVLAELGTQFNFEIMAMKGDIAVLATKDELAEVRGEISELRTEMHREMRDLQRGLTFSMLAALGANSTLIIGVLALLR